MSSLPNWKVNRRFEWCIETIEKLFICEAATSAPGTLGFLYTRAKEEKERVGKLLEESDCYAATLHGIAFGELVADLENGLRTSLRGTGSTEVRINLVKAWRTLEQASKKPPSFDEFYGSLDRSQFDCSDGTIRLRNCSLSKPIKRESLLRQLEKWKLNKKKVTTIAY